MNKEKIIKKLGVSLLVTSLFAMMLQTSRTAVYAEEATTEAIESTEESFVETETKEEIGEEIESTTEVLSEETSEKSEDEVTNEEDSSTIEQDDETCESSIADGNQDVIYKIEPRIAEDSEKPVIDRESLHVDNHTVTIGDTVTISVKVTDNFAVDRVEATLRNDNTGQTILYHDLTYNEELDSYVYSVQINEKVTAGKWYVETIIAYDTTGNVSVQNFDEFTHTFMVINSQIDSEKPIIDKSTLTIDKDKVINGDVVTVSVKVSDNIEVSEVSISFYNSNAGTGLWNRYMSYNKETDMFEYNFAVDNTIQAGQWNIEYIFAYDTAGNSDHLIFGEDKYTFYVINDEVDSEKPIIDESTLSITPFIAKTDDIVKVSIVVTDNEAVRDVTIDFYNLDTHQSFYNLPMTYNSETEQYVYEFLIDDTIAAGHWDVDISAHDNMGNFSLLTGLQNYFFATDSGKEMHKWDKGYIEKPATETENGIKIYTCTVCHDTKEEIIPATGEKDDQEGNPDTDTNETETPDINPDDGNNGESDNHNPDNKPDNSKPDNNHTWKPSTPEEAKRYECFGKDKVQYVIPANSPYPITIENAMQGSKCFEVFEAVSNGYSIGRTYNIYPKGNRTNAPIGEKVKITLTIPDELRKEGRIFKMICVSGKGIPTVLEDLDESNGSITFETDKFYAFALVYNDTL